MGAVTTSLTEQASSIFADLGYDVSEDGDELRAERKWRVVHVTPADDDTVPSDGEFRCFVARSGEATETRHRIADARPDYDWAVIGVDDDGSYDVYRGPPHA